MNCRLTRRHLGAFVDGELDPATHIEFERHIEACAPCQEHLRFEVSFRAQTREALANVRAPASLEQRVLIALDRAPDPAEQREPLIRFLPMNPRHAIPLAAAAAAVLVLSGTVVSVDDGGGSQAASAASGTVPLLEDVVRLHSSSLPSDVPEARPQQVARYFQGKVEFPVRPAEFDRRDVQLVGARLSNVRDRRAAALYYSVQGHRVTMVVFDAPTELETGAMRTRLRGQDIFYRDVKGYTVPMRRHAGLTYAFTGDLGRDDLVRLAASARVTH